MVVTRIVVVVVVVVAVVVAVDVVAVVIVIVALFLFLIVEVAAVVLSPVGLSELAVPGTFSLSSQILRYDVCSLLIPSLNRPLPLSPLFPLLSPLSQMIVYQYQ